MRIGEENVSFLNINQGGCVVVNGGVCVTSSSNCCKAVLEQGCGHEPFMKFIIVNFTKIFLTSFYYKRHIFTPNLGLVASFVLGHAFTWE